MATNRDAYVYNFSRHTCAENAERMRQDYLNALQAREENPQLTVDEVIRIHSTNIKWDNQLRDNLRRKKKPQFDYSYIRKVAYRPFVAVNCYADYTFITRKLQMDRIFPDSSSENRVICVSGRGSTKPFSTLVTDTMPDLELISKGQCFPRYRYPKPADTLDRSQTFEDINDVSGRIDNMSDTAAGFSVNITTTRKLRRMQFSIMSMAFYMRRAIGRHLRTTCQRNLHGSRSRRISMRSRRRGKRLGNFTSATRGVNGIRLRSYSHMKGNRTRGIFD